MMILKACSIFSFPFCVSDFFYVVRKFESGSVLYEWVRFWFLACWKFLVHVVFMLFIFFVNFWRLWSRIPEREKGFVFVTLIAAAANDWSPQCQNFNALFIAAFLGLDQMMCPFGQFWTKMPLQLGWTRLGLKKD